MCRSLIKRLSKQQGHSFIELLVAIVIIGILAIIMAPRVVGVLSDAKEKACLANYKSLESALERYYVKAGQYPKDLASLIPDYIKSIPNCPVNAALSYADDYKAGLPDQQSYALNHPLH